ncbi:hypothetical protein BDY21DRAFT_340829 [Lineolata rhizophorae]|uniref:Uncharacterized protein n=1 Tax=Lineolata rhizophorae TaxID=578093 RepID=A0A6A6P4C2_9PEZI|nr:hypothetical protein BDY21DRAFT_340829 [Lineolata rhizophorae]
MQARAYPFSGAPVPEREELCTRLPRWLRPTSGPGCLKIDSSCFRQGCGLRACGLAGVCAWSVGAWREGRAADSSVLGPLAGGVADPALRHFPRTTTGTCRRHLSSGDGFQGEGGQRRGRDVSRRSWKPHVWREGQWLNADGRLQLSQRRIDWR